MTSSSFFLAPATVDALAVVGFDLKPDPAAFDAALDDTTNQLAA